MNQYFRLDATRSPVPCDLERWCDEPDRRLLETTVSDRAYILTIFRSINPEPDAFFETLYIENGRRTPLGTAATWREVMTIHEAAAALRKETP